MSTSRKLKIEQTAFMDTIDRESTADLEWYNRRALELRIMKLARSHANLQEISTNCGLTPRQEKREFNIEQELTAICHQLNLKGVKFSGDPRGCTVKILLPSGETNDWGQIGYCVPTF